MELVKEGEGVLDSEDLELAGLLSGLGLDPKAAKVLTFLARVAEGKSRDIERGCSLRQPEVSLATRDLRELGWVKTEERKRGGKGRPVHFYRLAEPLQGILESLEKRKLAEIEAELSKIRRLRSLIGRMASSPTTTPAR